MIIRAGSTGELRVPGPDSLDPRLNCHSKLHEVIALVQAPHVGADEIMASMECDPARVVSEVILGDYDRPVVFFKSMTHQSTGFAPYQPKAGPFPDELRPLLKECQPCYERLLEYAIE
jgi:hypothetical protein